MAEDAVDDLYFGCNRTMSETVKKKIFRTENTGAFAKVWKKAATCATGKLKRRAAGDEALTGDHMQAICVYTSDNNDDFYQTFNDAVRSSREEYGTTFPFHSLHFWLTSAVQILNKNKCHTSYRRTDLDFTGKVDQIIRFGSFASTSYKSSMVTFGNKTCFKIRTCSGGFLKHYSVVEEEEEVLIPPYEMFSITGKKKGPGVKDLEDCGVVFSLQSAGVQSNLNCQAVGGRLGTFSPTSC